MTPTTPRGQVLRDADGMRLEFVRDYDEPVEGVWSALTDPDRVARWFGVWTGDPSTGAIQVAMTAEEGSVSEPMRILVCEPPTRLVVETETPDGTWNLSVVLEPRGSGTRLVFVQRMAEPYDASSIGPGWHFYLDRLGAVVAGTEVPGDFDVYFPALQGAYALPS